MVDVRLVNVSKKGRRKDVLKDVSLEIRDKELFILAGPPGAGKTTILKIVAGLVSPDEGEVYIGNEMVNAVPAAERDVGMVFESPAIYPNITGFDNIAFPLTLKKLPESEIKSRVTEIAQMLQISHLLDRKPTTYSGGELQRVALARVLIRKPRVLLLDEPLKNLDAKIRERMRAELKRLQRELGITMIFSTHDQLEAMTVGDRIAVVDDGVINQVDTPEKAYASPRTVVVARFIGSPTMNLVDCKLKEIDGRWILDATDFEIDVTGREVTRAYSSGSSLVLGIRPEDIGIADLGKGAGRTAGMVHMTQNVGDETVVAVKVGNTIMNTVISKGRIVRYGEKVSVDFRDEKVHIFDKKTQTAIL